jgi:hypothetical protein
MKKLMSLTLVLMLILTLAACGGETAQLADNNLTPPPSDGDNTPTPTPNSTQNIEDEFEHDDYVIKEKIVEKVLSSMPEEVAEAFRQVLLGQAEFRDIWQGTATSTSLYDFSYDAISESPLRLEFAVADLDGDGIPEVIVNDKGPDDRLVLHYKDGVVYGYFSGIRAFQEIKIDGTFAVSFGMRAGGGIARMHFTEDGYEYVWLKNQEWCDVEEQYTFFIDGNEVTAEESRTFSIAQNDKEEVEWHDLYVWSERE